MCNVTPCSLKSCTLKLVARMSLLWSSKINTFHTNGPCLSFSKGITASDFSWLGTGDEVDDRDGIPPEVEGFVMGSLRCVGVSFKLMSVKRELVWASKSEGDRAMGGSFKSNVLIDLGTSEEVLKWFEVVPHGY